MHASGHNNLRKIALSLTCYLMTWSAHSDTPFDQIPGVGPIEGWESPTRLAFLARMDRLIAFRAGEIPVGRDHSIYIALSASGSETGGGNSGSTPQSPFLVRHMLDLRELLSTTLKPDTTVYFRQGDSFYAEASNTPQGISIPDLGKCSFSSYVDESAPSTDKPRLLGFRRESRDGWMVVSPGVIERNLPYSAFWVRGRLPGSDSNHAYRAEPYIKQLSLDSVALTPRSFCMSSSGVLRVNIGFPISDDIASLELACAKGPGINLNDSPSVRLDNLIIEGWGTDVPENGDGAIRSSQSGTNTLLITDCEWGWTAYHGLLHATSLSGGIITLVNCQFGYHTNRDAANYGGGDGAVSFALLGFNEFMLDHCLAFGGGLRRAGVAGADSDIQGYPVYMHTNGLTPIALHVRRNCTFVPTSQTRSRYSDYGATPQGFVALDGSLASQPADPLDVRYYRSFIVSESSEIDGAQNGGASKTIDINCRSRFIVHGGVSKHFLWGTGTNTYDGLSINRDLELACPSIMPGYLTLSESQFQHRHVALHGRLRLTGAEIAAPPSFFSTEVHDGRLDNCLVMSSVISNETSCSNPVWNYPDRPSTAESGGVNYCAFFAIPTGSWSHTQSPIALQSAPTYPATLTGISQVPESFIARVPNGATSVEYDILRRRRPIPSTIGPLEAGPMPCEGDFNADSTIDMFDYLDFVQALAQANSAADFNRDGLIDLFDYLDFVAAFSDC